MKIEITGFNSKNVRIFNSIKPLTFEQYIGKFGFETYFKLTFDKKIPNNMTTVLVKIENQKAITCVINSIEEIFENGDHYFCVNLKNYVSQAYENQVQPTTYAELSTETLYRTYIRPNNLHFSENLKENKDFLKKKIKNFCVNFGMTTFNVLELFFYHATLKNVITTEDGVLDIATPSKNSINFGKGELDYDYLKIVDDRSKIISKVYMSSAEDRTKFLTSEEENIFAKECNISRKIFVKTPPELQILPASGAIFLAKKFNEKRFNLKLKTQHYIKIYPFDTVIISTNEGVKKKCYVKNVRVKLTQKGEETTLTLGEILK